MGHITNIKKNRLSREEMAQIKKIGTELIRSIKDTQTVSREDAAGFHTLVEQEMPSSAPSPLKHKVMTLIAKCRKEVNEEDLPRLQADMKAFFASQPKQPYYLLMDRRKETEDKRIVIIGDTHCDYNSLAGIFEKLSYSTYDYFQNATFIFLGDYLDRGNILFEYLLLLFGLKKLLGERCIFMKGNHEWIEYDQPTQSLKSFVYPADSCPTLNEYCGTDKEFLAQFAGFFTNLPVYILLKTPKGTDLLVHGGIPRDLYMDQCTISSKTGEMLVEGDERIREMALGNMIWADPRTEKVKLQGGGSRFEFGSEQFERFVTRNKIDRIIRSHEPVQNGVEAFYANRLYTVFSNGGGSNPITGYPEVDNPVFAIMGADGELRFESIFYKKVTVCKSMASFSAFLNRGEELMAGIGMDQLHLNDEFFIINQ